MTIAPNIAVVGAGLIGRRHVDLVANRARLAAIVDPHPSAARLAEAHGAPWFPSLDACLAQERPDGAIIATPNQLHADHGCACLEAGVPTLVEKPIADQVDAAERLVATAARAGAPLLVGHHRRHNPLIAAAKAAIDAGRLGRIVSVDARFWLHKPDDYFEPRWRREAGAGPVFINLIHDIDLLRHLCGDIRSVRALESRRARGHEVEDTAAILLEFDNGALGTVTASDAVVAPWSWEFTAKENPAYPHIAGQCYAIGGSDASLSIPDLTIWRHPGEKSWWRPMVSETLDYRAADPLERQIDHFVAVIVDGAAPLVSGADGLETLRVIEAVKAAAATGAAQTVGGAAPV